MLDLRLPYQPQSVTSHWPVRNYTAWWLMGHKSVNNLPVVITQPRRDRELNPRLLDRKFDTQPVAPLRSTPHRVTKSLCSPFLQKNIDFSSHQKRRLKRRHELSLSHVQSTYEKYSPQNNCRQRTKINTSSIYNKWEYQVITVCAIYSN